MIKKENTTKSFVLRIDAATMEAIEKWAADEFRSTNGQLQWIISEALRKSGRLKRRNPQKQQTNNFHHFQPSHYRTRYNSRQKSYRLERITRLALTDNFIHETSSAFTERTTYTQHLAACKSKAENGIYLNFKLRHSRTYFLKYRNEPTCGTTCF